MRAGHLWLLSFLAYPIIGAPFVKARVFRVFGLPTRAVLSTGVGRAPESEEPVGGERVEVAAWHQVGAVDLEGGREEQVIGKASSSRQHVVGGHRRSAGRESHGLSVAERAGADLAP